MDFSIGVHFQALGSQALWTVTGTRGRSADADLDQTPPFGQSTTTTACNHPRLMFAIIPMLTRSDERFQSAGRVQLCRI